MIDGFASNIARCANENKIRMHGMKSHDYHVLMECLLPICFRSFSEFMWNGFVDLSLLFKDLCSNTLRMNDLVKMKENIPKWKLERIFPPTFFDLMEHLVIHLRMEEIFGGPTP